MALTDAGKQFAVVIREEEGKATVERCRKQLKLIARAYKKYFTSFAAIIHDFDFNQEGVFETPHIHVVFWGETRVRGSTLLNYLADSLSVNPLSVSVEVCKNLVGAHRYLLHLDDTDKQAYSFLDLVFSGKAAENEFNRSVSVSDELTPEAILCLLEECSWKLSNVLIRIGVRRYNSYRLIFKDLIFEHNPLDKRSPVCPKKETPAD